MRARLLIGALLIAVVAMGGDSLSAFGKQWSVINASDWKIENLEGLSVMQLLNPRGPLPGPRRPVQFALAQTGAFSRVRIEMDMRPRGRSLIIVFAFKDEAHFDYAHLSIDTGEQQPVHNGIFHVYGGERVRISSPAGPPAFQQTNRWYHVIFDHDGRSGDVHISVNGRAVPALHAVDLSLAVGKVGVGSFDEVGDFRDVKLSGTLFEH